MTPKTIFIIEKLFKDIIWITKNKYNILTYFVRHFK